MGKAAERQIENEIAPERESLSAAEAERIRARCAGALDQGVGALVDASPPVAPRRTARLEASLYVGLLGQAFGFLHLYERSGDNDHLKLAKDYLDAGRVAIDRSSLPPPAQWLSFHAAGGYSALAAVVHDRLGDTSSRDRDLANYRQLASVAASRDYPSEDLLWGRGGFLFGAAFLRSRLGEESIEDGAVVGAMEAMIEKARELGRLHAPELTEGPHGRSPLVVLNFNRALFRWFVRSLMGSRLAVARGLADAVAGVLSAFSDWSSDFPHRYDIGLVHGVPGALYLLMHFPALLEARPDWSDDIRATLDSLTDCIDDEAGILELFPSSRSDAIHARARTPRFSQRVHWCAGTPGATFVFARAYQVFEHEPYREAAERCGEHVWRQGLLTKGNGICHGIAGNGYAFLALHRATSDPRHLDRALHFADLSFDERITSRQSTPDRPWSLYEGAMGTLCFYQDCLDPERARFPAFEV